MKKLNSMMFLSYFKIMAPMDLSFQNYLTFQKLILEKNIPHVITKSIKIR